MIDMAGKNISANVLWSFSERIGIQGVSFIVSIILARLLEPEDYGIVAIATVFQSILGIFVDAGFNGALVQKKNVDDIDFSSVFFFNIFMGVLIYLVVWFAAPFFASFYCMSQLTAIMRASGVSILVAGGFRSILIAKIQRELNYRKFFFASLFAMVGSAVMGISMAYNGLGVWALVAQGLTQVMVGTPCLWLSVKWRPICKFSFRRLKGLLSFGWKIFLAMLFNTFYARTRDLIIGKRYSANDLAFYNKGSGWPHLLFANIGGAVDSVMYPVFSQLQDDQDKMKKMIGRTINLNSFLVFPMLMGLSICSPTLIRIVLTEKWMACNLYVRIFCLVYGLEVIANTNLNSLRAQGRSDLYLKTALTKQVIDLITIAITMWISVAALACGLVFSNVVYLLVGGSYVRRLFDFPWHEQIGSFLPNVFLVLGMSVPVCALSFLRMSAVGILMAQIFTGMVCYFSLARVFKVQGYVFLCNYFERFAALLGAR